MPPAQRSWGAAVALRAIPSALTSFSFPASAGASYSASALCTITCPAGPQGWGGQPAPSPIRLLEGSGCQGEGLGHWRPTRKQCWGSCPSRVAISGSTLVTAYVTSPAQPWLPPRCPSPRPSSRQCHLSSPWLPGFCILSLFDGSTKSKCLDGQKDRCTQPMQHTCKYFS